MVHAHRTSSGISFAVAVDVAVVELVAEVEDQLPRRQRRAARGRRADRGAAAALRAGVGVEHLLPVEVVERGDAGAALARRVERGHRGGRHVRDRQRPLRAARRQLREEQVGDRGDDVEVLAQRQQAQEGEHGDVVQPPADLADRVRGRPAHAAQRGGRERAQRREVALVAVEVVRDQPAGVVQQPADHDEEDEEQDQHALPVGGVAVALLGAAEAEQARGVGDHAPVEHVQHAHDHDRLEHVAREVEGRAEQLVGPEAREVEVRVPGAAVQHEHLQHQDDEAPEDQRVHDPGGLLAGEELALADPEHERALEPLGDAVEPAGRLRGEQAPRTHGDDPGEHEQPERPEDREGDVAQRRSRR